MICHLLDLMFQLAWLLALTRQLNLNSNHTNGIHMLDNQNQDAAKNLDKLLPTSNFWAQWLNSPFSAWTLFKIELRLYHSSAHTLMKSMINWTYWLRKELPAQAANSAKNWTLRVLIILKAMQAISRTLRKDLQLPWLFYAQ